jgi:hypothetical protein
LIIYQSLDALITCGPGSTYGDIDRGVASQVGVLAETVMSLSESHAGAAAGDEAWVAGQVSSSLHDWDDAMPWKASSGRGRPRKEGHTGIDGRQAAEEGRGPWSHARSWGSDRLGVVESGLDAIDPVGDIVVVLDRSLLGHFSKLGIYGGKGEVLKGGIRKPTGKRVRAKWFKLDVMRKQGRAGNIIWESVVTG